MVVQVIDFSTASASPLNPLSAQVRQFIMARLREGLQNPHVTSLVLTGGLQHFSAGADLTEFASFSAATLQSKTSATITLIDVVQALEDSTKPIVAAIAGTCLGGGLELALACHYRVALDAPTTKLGLPEVHVGVIPGAGGTQRLPKVVGLATACQMILTGQALRASAALKAKLVDAVVADPAQLLSKAQQWASWAEVMPLDERRLGRQPLQEAPPMAHNILEQAQLALPPGKGNQGMEAALRALRASYLPLEQGMAVESQAFLETLVSEQGKARRHAFFAVRQAQKLVYPHLAKRVAAQHGLLSKTTKTTPIPTAVIGAGTMGSGIAMVLLQAGYQVTLVDVHAPALQKGLDNIAKSLQSQVKRRKLRPAVAQAMSQRLQSTTTLQDLGHCQLVVEAVVENLQIKQGIFQTLDRVTPPSCVLVSNTSTLDIDAMASVLSPQRQEWFMGWHFFSPAHVMKLVEIVVGQKTSPQAVTLLQVLSKKVGKIAVVVGNCDGFCGNRLLRPYSLECSYLVGTGAASIAQVDHAIQHDLGAALGPLAMGDLAGNDVGYNIRRERKWTRDTNLPLAQAPIPPQRPARYTELADVMITDLGRIGQKAGKGWYDYDPAVGKGRTPLPSKEMDALVEKYVSQLPPSQRSPKMSAEEIVKDCYFPLVNEGFKCLEEGIALRPSDIDVVYLYGYGFPMWRGGPMHWADHQVGLPSILTWLERMSRANPTTDHFVPSALLVECVRQGITVEEYYRRKEKKETQQSKL
mmetsp:Transcript_5597/g.11849  ORF Transcript_5597/g.11849 Transcript_5597/m.11849 type:complete len:754 (-) Transcript_5597:1464-3725(-)|eukprot:CAMPEP_0172464182 /NCGR_PEP_ID=MMETSP1065-20121228/49624_1 /TAXON_ID=265537 /ORGANISM="Amphiprora paludosa, Strain CCMP125" /LENGTH=753 /DNA_ID=CAMNT_0013220347 /DNA_START=62 /DNA_END=2323 /DNA_ORIENTATION=-